MLPLLRHLTCLMVVLLPTLLPAQQPYRYRYYYVGTLSNRTIQMDMQVAGTTASGTYFYQQVGTPLTLSGARAADGVISLEEQDAKKQKTGTFRGTLTSPQRDFMGTWSSPDGKKTFPFILKRVAEYVFLTTSQGEKLIATTSYPYFVTSTPAFQQINKTVQEMMTTQHHQFIREAQNEDRDRSGRGFEQRYRYAMAYYAPSLVSLFADAYESSSAARDDTGHAGLHFWLHDDKAVPVTLETLFVADSSYIDVLSAYCLKELRQQQAPRVVKGEVTRLQAEDLRVFSLTPRGITLAFAPPQVGPSPQGFFFVTVPYKALEQVVDPEGPLRPFVVSK